MWPVYTMIGIALAVLLVALVLAAVAALAPLEARRPENGRPYREPSSC